MASSMAMPSRLVCASRLIVAFSLIAIITPYNSGMTYVYHTSNQSCQLGPRYLFVSAASLFAADSGGSSANASAGVR